MNNFVLATRYEPLLKNVKTEEYDLQLSVSVPKKKSFFGGKDADSIHFLRICTSKLYLIKIGKKKASVCVFFFFQTLK